MSSISIVIPTYNGERFLSETVDSVISQTVRDWELVIVDDGSKDNSVALARHYAERDARIQVIVQRNGGVANARNRGYAAANPTSRYVIFLDQDDIWEVDTLATLLKALEDQPTAVAAHALAESVDDMGRTIAPGLLEQGNFARRAIVGQRPRPWPADCPTTLNVLALRNIVTTPGQILIRRAALDAVGPFDPLMPPADDWDMWLRLSAYGEIAFVNKVVIGWRQHSSNASHQKHAIHDAEIRVFRKLWNAPTLSEQQQQLVHLGYRLFRRDNGRLYWRWAKEDAIHLRWWSAAKKVRRALIEFASSY